MPDTTPTPRPRRGDDTTLAAIALMRTVLINHTLMDKRTATEMVVDMLSALDTAGLRVISASS